MVTLSLQRQGSFIIVNILVLLLVVLLSKDPFSGQNAISELEPSPDAIHYLSPVKSVLEGQGFAITYQARHLSTLVPPLYSLTLIPFYALFHDIRSFYFLNVGLVILSAYFFLKLILFIFPNRLIQILVFFGFCTNFIIFWYPSYPMAENLLIFLTVFSFWLLTMPNSRLEDSRKRTILIGLTAGLMYATKYVAWVEGFFLVAAYFLQIWQTEAGKRGKVGHSLLMILSLATVLLLSIYFEYLTKGLGVITSISSNLQVLVSLIWHTNSSPGLVDKSSLFYHAPFWDNFVRYIFGLIGGPVTIAGQEFVLVPPVIGFGAVLAAFLFFWSRANKWLFYYLIGSIIGTLFYLSAFQTVDARYFFAFIPGLILLFGFTLQGLVNLLEKLHQDSIAKIILVILALVLFVSSVPPIIQGFKTNWTHSDSSQNFQTITTMNNFFLSHHFDKRPTVVTILSPYQVDFFSTHSFELLPLSKRQYFTKSEPQTWGISKNLDYLEIYQSYLAQGKPLFVSTYHTSKDFIFWKDLQAIQQKFNLNKVMNGCNGECDLYQIDSPRTNISY